MINTNTMKNKILLCFLLFSFFTTSNLIASDFENLANARKSSSESLSYNSSFLGPILGLDDTLQYKVTDCGTMIDVCVDIPLSDISDYQITNNGSPYANGIAGCDFDTLNSYSYTTLFGQGALGPYILQSWTINGSIFSAPFNTINELVDSMNVWDPTGNWANDDPNNEITGGTPGNTYSDMVIWSVVISSSTILTRMDDITTHGTAINFGVGNNEVVVVDNVNGGSDTVIVQIACLNPETINSTIHVGNTDTLCLDFNELLGDVNSVTNLCAGSNVQFQLINADSCVQFTGLTVGVDTSCFEMCDVFGFCDTTFLIVNSQPLVGTHEFYDTIYTAETGTFCVNTNVFAGNLDTIYNICSGNSGTFASFLIDENNYCIDYTGLTNGGTDIACIVVCDDTNVCDTTNLNITVRRNGPAFFGDTIFINESVTFCGIDTSNLSGTITGFYNDCPGSSGVNVFFDPIFNTKCVYYDGIGVGTDTACIFIVDDLGNQDTTFMIVSVVLPTSTIVYDTIRLGLSPEYCVDTTELMGDIISIQNDCPQSSGTNVIFTINNATFCITAEAIGIGTDTACIVICDDLGVCDTTTYIITVDEDLGNPVAVDDFDEIDMNTEMQIDVCANDTIPPNLPLTNFFVLPANLGGVGPTNGTVFSNNDCTVNYVPNNDYCGLDSFTYVICNMVACDTANVYVSVLCPPGEFRVFNAFSPNGDGVNDAFKINGLDNFPNHELFVYNRWGVLVYNAVDYQNDWEGRWEGSYLPDGTYFYVLDDGEGNKHSGYVYIQR